MKSRVRAVIIKDDSLLTIKRVKPSEIYWVFPGGGVEAGEDNASALIRECKEELGVQVDVAELLFENLFIRKNGEEQKEYFYKCVITGGELGTGDGPEYQDESGYEGSHELEWLKINELGNFNLKPLKVKNGAIDLYNK